MSGISVGEVVRLQHYPTMEGRFRVYMVVSVVLGGANQESTYELRTCDYLENETIHVPCIILDTHPGVMIYDVDKWISLPIVLKRRAKK